MIKLQERMDKKKFEGAGFFYNEPMCLHTSFKIGGPADLFFVPKTIKHIEDIIGLCIELDIPYYIMGNGSNLLVSDRGYRGVIIQICKNMSEYRIDGNRVYAQGGILLSSLSKHIYKAGLRGFEFASGIPGTLGGAVYMNAGAYGGEIKDVIIEAETLTRKGEVRILTKEALELGYRHSSLQIHEDIVLSATLVLEQGDKKTIKMLMQDLGQRRKDKQPIELPSAGSTFKRPEGHYAGKLIMDAGLSGYRIGDARVSIKHCGFVVNEGQATCKEVLELIDYIQYEVKTKFDVDLETEVRIIGEF
ncbi:UDP-N-acetylmuramate dehydrogenase [Petrocella sp. FN5]|uniref:UDP-N-acetylmuramate dehydrogenase n=1 Tax=Petrocella sp. FN5 TaxID=3032002 RepID=UPI0023DC595C|nr:UDP-N-acetylmuramate dehydrogenase [Petrocella sp. FN5]MDF1617336.1 UDP-N-acetylmuramate dehydrogenase [Petrocella sp. FN5]